MRKGSDERKDPISLAGGNKQLRSLQMGGT